MNPTEHTNMRKLANGVVGLLLVIAVVGALTKSKVVDQGIAALIVLAGVISVVGLVMLSAKNESTALARSETLPDTQGDELMSAAQGKFAFSDETHDHVLHVAFAHTRRTRSFV